VLFYYPTTGKGQRQAILNSIRYHPAFHLQIFNFIWIFTVKMNYFIFVIQISCNERIFFPLFY